MFIVYYSFFNTRSTLHISFHLTLIISIICLLVFLPNQMTIEIVVSHKSDIKRVCFQVTTGQSNIGGLPCMLHVEWILFILKKKYTRLNIYSKLDGVGPI